ncbi:MAG: putative Ig domain-containing protein [Pseudomonadota bacterium]
MDSGTWWPLIGGRVKNVVAGVSTPVAQGGLVDVSLFRGLGATIVDIVNDFSGGGLTYTLAPSSEALPAGLQLGSNGTIFGTPTELTSGRNIVIRATNSFGFADSAFGLAVNPLEYSISLTGLTSNPTFGPSAQTGVVLTADASDFNGPPPSSVTYQWETVESGPIAGATSATYTPNASSNDGETLFCRITPDFYPTLTTDAFTIRQIPPSAAGGLADEIFDFGTGPQAIPTAGDFTGGGLTFSVLGQNATINSQTGIVEIATSAAIQAETITVTATSTGGSASSDFLVTVEGSGDLNVNFGALTKAGAGAFPVPGASISTGDPQGHWQISGGMLSPSSAGDAADLSAGGYLLTLNDGTTVDIAVDADSAHVSAAGQLNTALQELPISGGNVFVRDGDYISEGRQILSARQFTGEAVIAPDFWTDPGTGAPTWTRGVKLPGITLANGMRGLTIEGMELFADDAAAVITIRRPAEDILIRQNEIRSVDLATEHAAGRMQDGSMSSIEGVDGIENGTLTHVRVLNNYIHDVFRGASMNGGVTDNANGPCQINGNWFENCYQFFTLMGNVFTSVGTHGAEIIDNRGLHVWSTTADSGAPHSSTGLAFDSEADGLKVLGNIMHIGWTRIDAEPGFVTGATGMKLNGPLATDAYKNIELGFNVIVTKGLAIEVQGGANVDVFNNTVIRDDLNPGTTASISFEGVENARVWNNIANVYNIGTFDGDSRKGAGIIPFVTTLDTLQGYGNIREGSETYFPVVDDPTYPQIRIEDLETLFLPAQTRYARTAEQKKGALGTGRYFGNGVHTAVYDPPRATLGSGFAAFGTFWDGSDYINDVPSLPPDMTAFTVLHEGSFEADGVQMFLFGSQFRRFEVERTNSNRLRVYGKNAANEIILTCTSNFTVTQADGVVRLGIAVDMFRGVCVMTKNGVQDRWIADYDISRGETVDGSRSTHIYAQFANQQHLVGEVYRTWINDTFFDLDNEANIEAIYSETGAFQDFGPNGELVTGSAPRLYLAGQASTFGNFGSLGQVTVNGQLQDVAGSGGDEGSGGSGGSGGTYTPEAITFHTGDYTGDLALTDGTDLVIALRFRVGAGAPQGRILLDGFSNTFLQYYASGDFIRLRVENALGTSVTLESTSTFPNAGDEVSILALARIVDGATSMAELWIDGVLEDEDTANTLAGSSSLKLPRYINTADGAGANTSDMSLVGGVWIGNAGADSLTWSDFFDGSNQPTFDSASVGGVTARFFQNTVAGFNAGTNDGVDGDFTLSGSVD